MTVTGYLYLPLFLAKVATAFVVLKPHSRITGKSTVRVLPFEFSSSINDLSSYVESSKITSYPLSDTTAISSSHQILIAEEEGSLFDYAKTILSTSLNIGSVLFIVAGLFLLFYPIIMEKVITPQAAKELEKNVKELDMDLWNEYQDKLEPGQTIEQRPELLLELSQKMFKIMERNDNVMNNKGESATIDINIIDDFFDVAELMSQPPSGGVTFSAFSSLPPIALLSGEREIDLSKDELQECWNDGSLGATRVDRVGFERVWREIEEYFEEDFLEESRRECNKQHASITIENGSGNNEGLKDDNTQEKSAALDSKMLDKMFTVAGHMSLPPSTSKVTFAAFSSLPPIKLLSGDREEDLSKDELLECWQDGSLGATSVDRTGFERVWNEIQEYFDGDILEEARRTSTKSEILNSYSPDLVSQTQQPVTESFSSITTTTDVNNEIGNFGSIEKDRRSINSNDDLSIILEQMRNMTPEQEEQLKAAGVDPAMMKMSAQKIENNPMLKMTATAMIKMLSPEQLKVLSKSAKRGLDNINDKRGSN